MATKLNKWQIVLAVLGILTVVTIAVIIVPLVVLNNIKTPGVAKQKTFYIYDDITGEKISLAMPNYGFAPQHFNDKCYIERQIFSLAQDISDNLKDYKVEVVGNVIYIYKPEGNYFFIRKLGKEMVQNQGFEYRTSNSAKLLVKEGKVQQSKIYIPYHLMKVEENGPDSMKLLSGHVEQDLIYQTLVPYDKILEFYTSYALFNVNIDDNMATIQCKDIAFTVTRHGDDLVSFGKEISNNDL